MYIYIYIYYCYPFGSKCLLRKCLGYILEGEVASQTVFGSIRRWCCKSHLYFTQKTYAQTAQCSKPWLVDDYHFMGCYCLLIIHEVAILIYPSFHNIYQTSMYHVQLVPIVTGWFVGVIPWILIIIARFGHSNKVTVRSL